MADGMMQEVAMVVACVAMADRMLQDEGGHRVATLTGEWTTMKGATPKYGSYHMCCNKPTATCGDTRSW